MLLFWALFLKVQSKKIAVILGTFLKSAEQKEY
jgi:hypothetical protein